MPTISQLPAATSVAPADAIPISQGGVARSVSLGTLLASTQPAVLVGSPALMGRISLGPGGPEPVGVGVGLALSGGTLAANGMDHAALPLETALAAGDELVINSAGEPKLVQAALIRGLFSAGQNVSIDGSGVISVSGTVVPASSEGAVIANLPTATAMSVSDLVGISQGGLDHAITYAAFLNGQTIDMAEAAGPSGDSDAFWISQAGSSTMSRQTLGAVWVWLTSKLPSFKFPVIEITTDTALDGTVHNGRLLAASQPLTISALTTNMGSGFNCEIVNLGTGNVVFAAGIVTSSGSAILPPGQSAQLRCITYSGGTSVFASVTGGPGVGAAVPGSPTSLTASAIGSSSLTLAWQAPTGGSAVLSYSVQYRISGTTNWTHVNQSTSNTSASVTGLSPATSYDLTVTANNASGPGPASSVLTVTTAAGRAPGQVTGLEASAVSGSSISLVWTAPSSGDSVVSYTLQYRQAGSTTWSGSMTGIATTSQTVSGLQPSSSYDFEVIAVNASGSGPASQIATFSTAAGSASSITWNVGPTGPYTADTGSIAVNAHVTPASAPVQFGFSTSATVAPSVWTQAAFVNTDLWGAYVPTPATAGSWFAWAEGTDGSCPTVLSTPFTVS